MAWYLNIPLDNIEIIKFTKYTPKIGLKAATNTFPKVLVWGASDNPEAVWHWKLCFQAFRLDQ